MLSLSPQHIILWKNCHLLLVSFNTNPRVSPFLLFARCKSWVTFVRRCFRDATAFAVRTHVEVEKVYIKNICFRHLTPFNAEWQFGNFNNTVVLKIYTIEVWKTIGDFCTYQATGALNDKIRTGTFFDFNTSLFGQMHTLYKL